MLNGEWEGTSGKEGEVQVSNGDYIMTFGSRKTHRHKTRKEKRRVKEEKRRKG